MKIVLPWAKLVSDRSVFGSEKPEWMTPDEGTHLLRKIEWAARVSHRSEDKMTDDSYDRIVRDVVMRKGDFSVIEHASITVMAYHDRGIQQEWTRQRLMSPTIESTRFVNYANKMPPSFVYPKPEVECESCLAGNVPAPPLAGGSAWYHNEDHTHHAHPCVYDDDWLFLVNASEVTYMKLLAKGWRPQEARSVFTLGLGSLMVFTANVRQWRHVMLMRTTMETHPSFRQITIPLLKEFQRVMPILFEDITPLASQAVNMKKMR